MTNYKILYHHLFNKLTDLMEEMKLIQQETEERYIEMCDSDVVQLHLQTGYRRRGRKKMNRNCESYDRLIFRDDRKRGYRF